MSTDQSFPKPGLAGILQLAAAAFHLTGTIVLALGRQYRPRRWVINYHSLSLGLVTTMFNR